MNQTAANRVSDAINRFDRKPTSEVTARQLADVLIDKMLAPAMTDAEITEGVAAMVPYDETTAPTVSEFATKQVTAYAGELESIADALKLAETMLTTIRNGGSYDAMEYIASLLTIRNASDLASLYRRDAGSRIKV